MIKLTNSNLIILVDQVDIDRVNLYNWSLTGRDRKQIHAKTSQGLLMISNFIMRSTLLFDHIDRNFLNNKKDNFRICTVSENMANRVKFGGNTSIYKGVSYCERDSCWRAHIKINNKTKSLGTFITEKGAARSYNVHAKELFGEFAVLNKFESVG